MFWTTKIRDNPDVPQYRLKLNVTKRYILNDEKSGSQGFVSPSSFSPSRLDPLLTMKTIAAALVMAGSAAAFSPATTSKTTTSMEAMPDRMWDSMVDKSQRSASVPFLPKAPALDGSLPGDYGFDPFFLSSIPKNFAGFLQPPSWEETDGISTIYWMSTL